jgi:hypothetical protein
MFVAFAKLLRRVAAKPSKRKPDGILERNIFQPQAEFYRHFELCIKAQIRRKENRNAETVWSYKQIRAEENYMISVL